MYTISVINRELDNLKQRSLENADLLQRRSEEITYLETIGLQTSMCPVAAEVNEGLISIDESKIKETSRRQYYNYQAMKALSCTVDSMVSLPPASSWLTQSDKIRRWFDELRRIGTESAYGIAMTEHINKTKDLVIIKANRDPQDTGLDHELFVGYYGTNQLRKYIPNFSMLLGGFKCSPPIINPETKEVVSWCTNKGPQIRYVMYENIFPSISMREYVSTATPRQFLSAYMQILYALRLAVKVCDFTHYDLHYENVLMREVKNKLFQIEYPTENGVEFVEADRVATIIDYGFAHINTNSGSVGVTGVFAHGVNPDFSNPMFDAYKLLMFCARECIRVKNIPVLDEISKILFFYNSSQTVEEVAAAQKYYEFPFSGIDLDGYIRYIREVCDCSFITPVATLPVETCRDQCFTLNETLHQSGFTEETVPKNLFDFYDEISLNRDKPAELERLMRVFNYDKAIEDVDVVNYEQMLRVRDSIMIDLSTYPPNAVTSQEAVSAMRQMYLTIYTMRDVRYRLELNRNLMLEVSKLYGKTIDVSGIDTYLIELQETLDIMVPVARNNEMIYQRLTGQALFPDV